MADAFKFTKPTMTLTLNGVVVSRHREDSEITEAVINNGYGDYKIERPMASISYQKVDSEVPDPDPIDPVDPEPDPVEPEPAPEPAEPTPVEQPKLPDPSGKPADIHKPVDEARLLNFEEWNGSSRYTRARRLSILRHEKCVISFDCQDLTTKGSGKQLVLSGTYTLVQFYTRKVLATITVDGEAHALLKHGRRAVNFELDRSLLEPGDNVLDILSDNPEETSVPYSFFVPNADGSIPEQEFIPIGTGSHEIHDSFNLAWVPAIHAPLAWPTARREFPEFDFVPNESQIFVEMAIGSVTGSPASLVKNKDGILSAATKQRYFWHDLIAKYPVVELRDGPRGSNTHSMITHIMGGEARVQDSPDAPLVNNDYFTTPWSLCRKTPDGSVETLVGFRHKSTPNYWEDPPELELVGDYSAIAPDRRREQDIWGADTLPYTVAVDHSAPKITENGIARPPHFVDPKGFSGPTLLYASAAMNAIRAATFSHNKHGVIAKVTEFYVGNDPWDVKCWRDKVIISERGAHRVIQLDQYSNFERVIIQGEPLASLDYLRKMKPNEGVTLEQLRAQPIVGPEGIDIFGDELYISSPVMQQVRMVDLVTGEMTTPIPHVSGRLNFMKISVCKGKSGPARAIGVSKWDVGDPDIYLPDGKKWTLVPNPRGGIDRGRGGSGFTESSYQTAISFAPGRVLIATVGQGYRQISLALDTDPVIDAAKYNQGRQEFIDSGDYLGYGIHGDSVFGLPLPFGESENKDYYLTSLGHN